MLRKLSFVDEVTGTELTLPVTPPGYDWVRGVNYETIHIDQVGDLNFPAGKALHQGSIECLLPAQAYPFMVPGAVADPQRYLDQFNRWRRDYTVLRYIVSGTDINEAVRIESVRQGENDGTNDINVTLTLREYCAPEVAVTDAAVGSRSTDTAVTQTLIYVVQAGDTLWSIAKRFYGDGSLCWRLAAANGIKNANLIWPGQTLTIPVIGMLPSAVPAAQRPISARVAEAIKTESGNGPILLRSNLLQIRPAVK